MTMRLQNKVLAALEDFFDSRSSDILQLSHRMTTLPDNIQEGIWELVINYIQATADRDKGWTPMMNVYIEQARDIRDNL